MVGCAAAYGARIAGKEAGEPDDRVIQGRRRGVAALSGGLVA